MTHTSISSPRKARVAMNDDHSRMLTVMNNLILHLHPTRVPTLPILPIRPKPPGTSWACKSSCCTCTLAILILPGLILLVLGECLYDTTCAVCHGDNGSGITGPVLNSQQILTRNSDADLCQTIIYGPHRPGSIMPAFGDRFTSVEIDAIVQYGRA